MKSILFKTFLVASALAVSASATIIDNFNAPTGLGLFQVSCTQAPVNGCTPANQNNPVSGLDPLQTITGTRQLIAGFAPLTSGVGEVKATVGQFAGVLSVSSDIGMDPKVTVNYFVGPPPVGGWPVTNLLANNANLLHIVYTTDTGYNMTLNLNGVPVTVALNSNFNEAFFDLSAWGPGLGNLTSASFILEAFQKGGDITIDLIETTTPEPMTFAMMGAGLLALGALRLRKRS